MERSSGREPILSCSRAQASMPDESDERRSEWASTDCDAGGYYLPRLSMLCGETTDSSHQQAVHRIIPPRRGSGSEARSSLPCPRGGGAQSCLQLSSGTTSSSLESSVEGEEGVGRPCLLSFFPKRKRCVVLHKWLQAEAERSAL